MRLVDYGLGRREFILAAGGAALAAGSTSANAKNFAGADFPDLAHAAIECSLSGSACLNHCVADLRTGSTTLVECLDRVQDLVAACDALAKLAAYGSPHLPQFAAATAEVCKTCEKECRKHEGHHEPCGECADSCVACARECASLIENA